MTGDTAHIKRVTACGSPGLGCEAIGELSIVVGEQLDDLHGRSQMQLLQEMDRTGFGLVRIDADMHPARGTVDGHEEVAALALVGHLGQVLDINVHEARLIVFEGLARYRLTLKRRIEFELQGTQIAHPIAVQAAPQCRARDVGAEKFARDDQQVVQGQQQQATQLHHDGLPSRREVGVELVRAMAQILGQLASLLLAHCGLGDVIALGQLRLRGTRSLNFGAHQRSGGGLWMNSGHDGRVVESVLIVAIRPRTRSLAR